RSRSAGRRAAARRPGGRASREKRWFSWESRAAWAARGPCAFRSKPTLARREGCLSVSRLDAAIRAQLLSPRHRGPREAKRQPLERGFDDVVRVAPAQGLHVQREPAFGGERSE